MNRSTSLLVRSLLAATAALFAVGAADAGQIVIAHPSVAATNVSKATLEQIFTGIAKNYTNGMVIVVATLKDGPTHEAFLKSFLSKTPPQFTRAWRDLVFGGGAQRLPQAFEDEAALVAYVAKTKGAIGYIDEGTPHDGVKVLNVTD